MQQLLNAMLNKKGLTLVEVMIALVVLLIVSLALMQTALVSINANMTNVLRDEAVNIAEMSMNESRNTSFDSLAAGTTSGTVSRTLRNITNFSYAVTRTVTNLPPTNPNNKRLDIAVAWTWKGENYTHSITTIVKRP